MRLAEAAHVVNRGAAEGVDGLIEVAHHGHVAGSRGQREEQLDLGAVHILEFVNEHVPVAAHDLVAHGRALVEETPGESQLIARWSISPCRARRVW